MLLASCIGLFGLTRVAIIGAGLAGLTLAHKLAKFADVTVFEKSRGVGGRMATRYAGAFEFDHGAQFFTARSAAFREFLEPLLRAGVVETWPARFAELDRDHVTASRHWTDDYPHFVGAPRMNSVGAFLAEGISVCRETAVASLSRSADGWQLQDNAGDSLGCFDWVVMTAPPEQTGQLAPYGSSLGQSARGKEMSACFALMLGFAAPLQLDWDAARVRNSAVSWISVNSSKPGRDKAFTLVVHSTNAWANENLELDRERVMQHLLTATSAAIGSDAGSAQCIDLQRWRYANIDRQQGSPSHIDADERLAACGDWFLRGRVEAAYRSAAHLANSLAEQM